MSISSVSRGPTPAQARARSVLDGPLIRALRAFDNNPPTNYSWTAHAGSGGRARGVWSPSSISYCLRRNYFQRAGYDPRDRMHKIRPILDLGHSAHAMLQFKLGHILGGSFKDELSVRCVSPAMAGHADGMVEHTPELQELFGVMYPFGVEIKTINTNGFTRAPLTGTPNGPPMPKQEHRWQVLMYMFGTGVRIFHVLYFCKNDSKMIEIPYEWDDEEWSRVWTQRIWPVEQAIQAGTPTHHEGGKSECPTCPFLHHCEDGQVIAQGGQ